MTWPTSAQTSARLLRFGGSAAGEAPALAGAAVACGSGPSPALAGGVSAAELLGPAGGGGGPKWNAGGKPIAATAAGGGEMAGLTTNAGATGAGRAKVA
jgi:hypothetical protein